MSAEYEGSVEKVLRAFREADYWEARLAGSGVDEASLEAMRIGGESGNDGSIEVVTLQVVHSHKLPGFVTQLHRGDFCVRREETWGPITDGFATAALTASLVGAPATIAGTGVLSPIAGSGGSRLTCRLTVHVRVPLLGGKLENIIGNQLADLLIAEQQFTTEWLASQV